MDEREDYDEPPVPDPPCPLCDHPMSLHDMAGHCDTCEDWGGPCA